MKIIYVFGDSHSSMFNVGHRKDPSESAPAKFQVGFVDRSSGVPTAYSLAKYDDVIMKELESIPFKEGDEMWFIFGEIDVRFHIFYHHQRLEIPLDESINNVIDRYIPYVKKLRIMGYNIHIVSVVPPQPNPSPFFNDPTMEVMNPIRGKGITIEDRVYMTNKMNLELKKACIENDIPFRDVHPFLVDSETGCNIPEMTRDGMHYYYIGDLIMNRLCSGEV